VAEGSGIGHPSEVIVVDGRAVTAGDHAIDRGLVFEPASRDQADDRRVVPQAARTHGVLRLDVFRASNEMI